MPKYCWHNCLPEFLAHSSLLLIPLFFADPALIILFSPESFSCQSGVSPAILATTRMEGTVRVLLSAIFTLPRVLDALA